MFEVKRQEPRPELRPFVTAFTERRGRFGTLHSSRPLFARPNQFLEFYFRDPYRVGTKAYGFIPAPNGHNLPAGRTRMTLVYKRAVPVWKIAHGHNQDVDEGAQQFDPIRGAMGKR